MPDSPQLLKYSSHGLGSSSEKKKISACLAHRKPEFDIKNQAWQRTPAISVVRKWRQEVQEFKVILGFI